MRSRPTKRARLHRMIEERCPHLFAALPVFVSRQHVDEMAGVIGQWRK